LAVLSVPGLLGGHWRYGLGAHDRVPDRGAGVSLIQGFDRMLSCTTEFDATVAFVRDVLGLEVAAGPLVDPHWSRHALAFLPGGETLAVVEPTGSAEHMRGQQIPCLTVRDIRDATRELQRRGAVFAGELIDDGHGAASVYVRAPGAAVYQIHGPTPHGPRIDAGPALVTGFDWLLSCSVHFGETVAFIEEVLGLVVAERGDARFDPNFSRYAFARLPSGATLEVVEPAPAGERLRGRQILCLTVPDFRETRRELERRGAVFGSDVVSNDAGLAWIYVRAPGDVTYQIYGPVLA
jgi:catechol 2,3-dioxygenase-like lactoylglutathione lyase family enzyme